MGLPFGKTQVQRALEHASAAVATTLIPLTAGHDGLISAGFRCHSTSAHGERGSRVDHVPV